MKEFWNKIKKGVGIFVVPIILLFSTEVNLSLKERLGYLVDALSKSAVFLFIYMLISGWYEENRVFFIAISGALLGNLLVGAKYHWIKGTFDLKQMLIKNIEVLIVVFVAYALLMALSAPLSDNIIGVGFKMTIEFISILYPTSKALKNLFIITEGKHPPAFVIRALYNYEKEGKLKEFFDSLNGNGINENSEENEKSN